MVSAAPPSVVGTTKVPSPVPEATANGDPAAEELDDTLATVVVKFEGEAATHRITPLEQERLDAELFAYAYYVLYLFECCLDFDE